MSDLGLEHFEQYFAYAPAALALRECVRLAAIRGIDLPEPILDVGCGDGIFARLAYPDRQVWGIDINPAEVRRAQATAAYSTLICGSISDCDLPQGYFRAAIANCSLEHVPDLAGAFRTIHRALAPGAPFVLMVPTPDWTRELVVPRTLERAGLGGLARAYREGLDKVFHHVHLYDEAEWRTRLSDCGFSIERVVPIVSPAVTGAFDVLLYPSLVGWVNKRITGRWTMMPELRRWLSAVPRESIRALVSMLEATNGKTPGEYLIVATR